MTRTNGRRLPMLVRAFAALGIACAVRLGLAPPSSAASYAPISGAGSSWSAPAISTWIDDLNQLGISNAYSAAGSSSGLANFAQGTVDWAASELPYDTPGVSAPLARGYAYVPDTAGGIALMYNLT